MSKSNKTRTASPSPAPETTLTGPEAVIQTVQDMPAETAEIIALQSRQGRRVNALDVLNAKQTEAIQSKVALLSEAETAIAETVKLAGDIIVSEDQERKVAEAAAKAAHVLFRGRITGVLSQDELSELLGRGFGWKRKQDGTQSKTPFGQGEAIRKRVVRATGAYAFVNGNDAPAFFDPLDREAVAPFVQEVIAGKRSVLTLYNDLADMKAEASGKRPAPAFNPKAVMAMAAALSENVQASVTLWHDTAGLLVAYQTLSRAIDLIGEEYAVAYPDVIENVA